MKFFIHHSAFFIRQGVYCLVLSLFQSVNDPSVAVRATRERRVFLSQSGCKGTAFSFACKFLGEFFLRFFRGGGLLNEECRMKNEECRAMKYKVRARE